MTAQSNLILHSALSPDSSLAAIVVPSKNNNRNNNRHLVQVYQVSASTCSLQLTLTHTSEEALEDLVFCGDNSTVVGRFGVNEVVIWDLNRGVVAHKLLASEDQSFLALAAAVESSNNDHFYILTSHSQKLYVYEYSASNNKLVRKIKSGRWAEDDSSSTAAACCLTVSKTHVAVQTAAEGIRIMDLEKGQKVGKVKAKSIATGSSCSSLQLCGEKTLAAIDNSGVVVLYNLAGKPLVRIPHDGGASRVLQVVQQQNDQSSYTILVDSTLYKIQGSSHEKVSQLTASHPVALFLTAFGKLLALMYQKKLGGCRVQWTDLEADDVPSTIDLDKEEEDSAAVVDAKESASKRKTIEPIMLGPGQAGTEAPAAKKSKASSNKEDVEMETEEEGGEGKDISIGERLKQLTDALDDDEDEDDDDGTVQQTSFKAKKATTESLKELLSQALQSGDDSLLELALGVRDVKIISKTLKEIEPSLISVLLSKLTTRLASSPMRADQLAIWLSHCLKTGRFQTHQMAALRNLLYERIESFPDLVKLEGRLSMMCDVE